MAHYDSRRVRASGRGARLRIANKLPQTNPCRHVHPSTRQFLLVFFKYVYKSVNETVLETISARFFKYTTYLFRPSKHYRKLLSLLEVLPISYFKHATKSRVGVNWKILSVIFLALVLFIETS